MVNLRKFVRQVLINEAAKSIQDANLEHLALLTEKNDRDGLVILYDPSQYERYMQLQRKLEKRYGRPFRPFTSNGKEDQLLSVEDEAKEIETGSRNPVIAFGHLIDPANPSWGASELAMAAAIPGYGPLLHDIVMSVFGTVIVDRRDSVSVGERKLWRFYFEQRSDVEKLALDDIEHPRTKRPEDDAILQSPKTKENFLNYAYRLKTKLNIAQLKSNHTKCIKKMEKLGFPDVDDILPKLADRFFGDRYETVSYNDRDLKRGWIKA